MATYLNHLNLLLTISLLCFLVTLTCNGSPLSHDEECSALFQFKQSMIDQDDVECASGWFQTFQTWKPTRNTSDAGFDCCSWFGVECSKSEGHVIGLDLSESSLCGHITSTSTLFSLIHLQKLNLAMNYFNESQIPSEITRLKQLRSLNLSDSGFNGRIPNEISQLTQLCSLDLSSNQLKLPSPNGLKNLLQNLTGLEELDLSGVDISSSVPHFLSNFSSLRSLMLTDCSLQNEFPASILLLPKLKHVSVVRNTNLTGSFPEFYNNSLLESMRIASTGFFGTLPKSISNLNHLTFLGLSDCSFSGRIPGSFSNLTQLTHLGLGFNKFTGLVPSLASLSELNVLSLSSNNFNKWRFPIWFRKLTKLSELYLHDSNIYGEIPPFLGNLTKLSFIQMAENSLTGHIPSSFFNLTQVMMLDLNENELKGPISSSFSNFKRLETLRLSLNNFRGRVDLDKFLGLDKLSTLILGFNQISFVSDTSNTSTTLPGLIHLDLQACNLKEFPAFLRFKNKMTALFLGFNYIDGLVPVWVWNNSLETLEAIDCEYNSLTGFHQQPHFLPWRHLQAFIFGNNQLRGQLPITPQTTVIYHVSNNNLTGDIPQSLCDVKSLRMLDLSYNKLSGTIPSCLGSLSSLLVLNMRQNNFDGIKMDAFTHGSLLESIDFSENNFMGQLPRSLTNCTNLEVLSLGDNSFHGVFPFWLGTLANLQVLILRSNKLYGPIQGSMIAFSQFPKLRIIDLSNNSFSGQLHRKSFQSWNAMKSVYGGESSVSSVLESDLSYKYFTIKRPYTMTLMHKGVRTEYEEILTIFTAIDLSFNHFKGEIPISIQDLRGLESLNLSNNHFTGHILPSLGSLSNLESLDLSRNELSGVIPQQLVQLHFLSILNVSFNHLDGRIPEGQQFNTFENDSYQGNPGLCGIPLSNECQHTKGLILPPTSNTSDSSRAVLAIERTDWIFIFAGVGSGMVVGVVIGNLLYERYRDRFTKRKDIWVSPLRNTKTNQGGVISSRSKGKDNM